MAIPDFQTLMLPLLQLLSDGREYSTSQIHDVLADHFKLSSDEIAELLPSGTQARFRNRIGWAQSHFKKAGLVESPSRSVYRITQRGREFLGEGPAAITLTMLDRFPEHREFRAVRDRDVPVAAPRAQESLTPAELIERGHDQLREALASELLERIMAAPPRLMEKLVIDVMLAMNYGGSREDAGHALGKSGDEGVDGVINEDTLGLDAIYLQAKRWKSVVGRPEIQAFAGALQGKKARKGIFITTSYFSTEARQFVSSIENRIVLIDGKQLADLMIRYGVGVTNLQTYTVNKLDSDYFEESV